MANIKHKILVLRLTVSVLEQMKGKRQPVIMKNAQECGFNVRHWISNMVTFYVPAYLAYLFLLFQTRDHPRWNFNLVIIS